MRVQLQCMQRGCERRAVRRRDEVDYCLFHPDQDPPTPATVAAAKQAAQRQRARATAGRAPLLADQVQTVGAHSTVTPSLPGSSDVGHVLSLLAWLQDLASREGQAPRVTVQALKALRTVEAVHAALVKASTPAKTVKAKRTYTPESRARMVENGRRQAAYLAAKRAADSR